MTILEAILPPVGILLFFGIGLRALFQADRRERAAAARYERERDGGGSAGNPAAPQSPASPANDPQPTKGADAAE